jgi:hypothetical protein
MKPDPSPLFVSICTTVGATAPATAATGSSVLLESTTVGAGAPGEVGVDYALDVGCLGGELSCDLASAKPPPTSSSATRSAATSLLADRFGGCGVGVRGAPGGTGIDGGGGTGGAGGMVGNDEVGGGGVYVGADGGAGGVTGTCVDGCA